MLNVLLSIYGKLKYTLMLYLNIFVTVKLQFTILKVAVCLALHMKVDRMNDLSLCGGH